MVARNPWHFLSHSCITWISASITTWPSSLRLCVSIHRYLFPFLVKLPVIVIMADPNPVWHHLITYAKVQVPKAQIPSRLAFWGDTRQPSILLHLFFPCTVFLKTTTQGNNLHWSSCFKDNFYKNSNFLPNYHTKALQEVDICQDDTFLYFFSLLLD